MMRKLMKKVCNGKMGFYYKGYYEVIKVGWLNIYY